MPRYVIKPLSSEEVGALIGALNRRSPNGARDLAFLLLLLDTGMRLGEVTRMTVMDAEDAIRDGLFSRARRQVVGCGRSAPLSG